MQWWVIIIIFLLLVRIIYTTYTLTYINQEMIVYKDNERNVKAKEYLSSAVILGWCFVTIISGCLISFGVIIFVGYQESFSEKIWKNITYYEYSILSFIIFVFIVIGILSLSAAINLKYSSTLALNKEVYDDCYSTSVICLIGIAVTIIFFSIRIYISEKEIVF